MYRLRGLLLVTVFPVVLSGGIAEAQQGAPSSTRQPRSSRSPDFLFGRPSVTLGVRGLWRSSRADSEVFDFTRDLLTLEKKAFSGPGIAIDAAFPATERVDALFGFEYSRSSALSEYRDFVEDNDLPIEQITELSQVNLTGSVELALMPRGREIGRYAWIPGRIVPYIGAGGGLLWYEFAQQGDFIETVGCEVACPIFTAQLSSAGWTPSAHVAGGVDVKVTNRLYLSGEARYVWAHSAPEQDFLGFDDIDLAGLRFTGGIQFVF